MPAELYPSISIDPMSVSAAMTETPERAYPSGAVVMAFYAGGAMPGEVQATHLLAVVEVVEASRVSVGIPFRGGTP